MYSGAIEKIGDFFFKVVKLPPRTLIIALLMILNGVQFYTTKKLEDKHERTINIIIGKLDTCRIQNTSRDMYWSNKVDSIRIMYSEEMKEKNRHLESLIYNQEQNNYLIQKNINNLKKKKLI